jgi:hypothetical protein
MSMPPLAGVFQGAVAFAVYVIAALVMLRVARRVEPALVVVALAPLAWVAAIPLLLMLGKRFNFWVFTASYCFLTLGFQMAFGAVYKSLSLRILTNMLQQPGRADSYEAIFSRYLVEDSYQNRLAVTQEKGLVKLQDGHYELTESGRKLASRTQAVQRVFGILRSG